MGFFGKLFGSEKSEELSVEQESTVQESEDKPIKEDKSGWIYIISNEGSFGKGIYKIGMTKGKDPKARVKSLSDASVPFNFAIHALIPVEDAGEAEAQFHRFLRDKELNKINHKKEFFKCSLDEIKDVAKKLGYKVTWDDDAIDINYLKSLNKESYES